MKAIRSVLAFSIAAAAVAVGSLAFAEGPRVVLVGPSPEHPTVARVREELQVLGFEVEVLLAGTDASDLALLARERHAAAVARVEDWPPEIVLWVQPSQRAGEPAQGVEIRVSESLTGPVESALLALRATELLRGKLVPIAPEPQPEAGAAEPGRELHPVAPPAPRQLPPKAPPAPRRLPPEAPPAPKGTHSPISAWAAAAVLLSPGEVPATPQIRLGAGYHPLRRLGFEITAFIPPASATVWTPEGAIDLRTSAFGGNMVLTLTNPAAKFAVTASLGAGGLWIVFEGDAQPPFASASGSRWAALPYASIGMSYRTHPPFALRADAMMGIALPEPVVRAAERNVTSIGWPAMFFSFGIEVRL